MVQRLALVGIIVLGASVALLRVPVYAGIIIAQVTPTPPTVIPAWILGGGAFYRGQQATAAPTASFNDVDPGATPDRHLFAGVIDASDVADTSLETNCPGIGSGVPNISNCIPYKYVNMLLLLCETTLETDAYNYLNNTPDETGFLHTYTSAVQTPAPSNRLTAPGDCANPTPSPNSSAYPTNPDDATFKNWLATNVWTTAAPNNFPTPYGIYEDHFAVNGGPCDPSYEYGNVACNVQGVSHSPDPHDWETALGDFETNAETACSPCFPFTGNGLTLGDGNNTNPCKMISNGHCYVNGTGGVVDDMDALDNLCAAADSGGNLKAIAAEEIVFLKGDLQTGTPMSANTQTIVYMINTMSHLVNYTTGGCATTVAVDVEAPGGSFYPLDNYTPGTVSGGIPVREEAAALRFLVPNPSTLVPDRMQPLYFTIGGTNNNWPPSVNNCAVSPFCEVPYMFEETLVPQGPEVSVGAFTWNGKYASVGDNCATPPPKPDSGGAVDLLATCVSDVRQRRQRFRCGRFPPRI